jgi:hypothetical protein
MNLEQTGNLQRVADEGQSSSVETDSKRERSTISFAYSDLEDAVGVAQAIHGNAGTSCTLSQLAAFLDQPISSGAFRARISNAAIFGLTENARREVTLTDIGRRIADAAQEPQARVNAFLHVPLYLRIFEHHDGYMLPGPAPLERFMRDAGVAAKQTGKARQAFMRSARQAGFFAHGEDRLVRPSFPPPGTRPLAAGRERDVEKKPNGGGGNDGGGGERADIDPIIRGLLARLPKSGVVWPEADRKLWLELLAGSFKLIYKNQDNQASETREAEA